MKTTPLDRFMDKFICLPLGCWLWIASVSSGYGYFQYAGKREPAHRVSYKLFRGSIPKGLQIDHLCRVRRCVNPEHLEAVTVRENVLRGNGPTARHARKTHCPRGHEFTPENTYIWSIHKNRACKTCVRSYQNKKYVLDRAKRKET